MSDKIKIIFYNFLHIGDTYLSQSFVKNIIDNNGDKFEYFIWCHYNDYIYTCLFPNIKNIRDDEIIVDKTTVNENLLNGLNYYFIKETNVLLINTWIGCTIYSFNSDKKMFSHFYKYNIDECDVTSYIRTNAITISRIFKDTQVKINYNAVSYTKDKKVTLPCFSSTVNIDDFLEFKKNNKNRKIVFLNNNFAGSGQLLPIKSNEDYIRIIDFIIKKNYIIFLSEYNHEIALYKMIHNITDIYFTAQQFNVPINSSCYNVYYCAKVAHNCDLAIYFDTGKNFTYVNYDFIEEYNSGVNTNKKIHFGVNDYYFKNLSNPCYFPDNYASFVVTNNRDEIIQKLEQVTL
jgi:hypothetical protein